MLRVDRGHGLVNDPGDPARQTAFGVSAVRERFSHEGEEGPRHDLRLQLEAAACGPGPAGDHDQTVARVPTYFRSRLGDARLDLGGLAERAIQRCGRAMHQVVQGGLDRDGPTEIHRVQPLDERLALALEDRERDLGLVGEVVVEGADAQSRLDTDVADRRLGVAMFGERRRGGGDQPRARRRRPVCPTTALTFRT